MPSRPGLVLIMLFWLATTGYVTYRDVLPRYWAENAPALRIDLADEADTNKQIKWSIYRQVAPNRFEKIGGALTLVEYASEDDTFWFRTEYNDLRLRFLGVQLEFPTLRSNLRVSRAGHLREQQLDAEMRASSAGVVLASASADLRAKVRQSELFGELRFVSPAGRIERTLEPVPVPNGQVLNPLMPLNRLRDVRPGQTWVIRQVDPVRDAVATVIRDYARNSPFPIALPGGGSEAPELIATVRSQPVKLYPNDHVPVIVGLPRPPTDCWVIDYAGGEYRARTWVQVSDGRVMRQEAIGFGEELRIERDF